MTGIITQARVNSSRLPNKIFLEAAGKPFLSYHLERLKSAGVPVFIATTNDGSEEPIVNYCNQHGIDCFRGSETNVLERFYKCASFYNLTTIIRVTSDCPLIDGNIIAKGIKNYEELNDSDVYYSNALKRTYPRGMDYEIFSFRQLEDAYKNVTAASDKEHVTPYIWNNRSGSVKIEDDINTENNSKYRITLDTNEDKALITKLIEQYHAHQLSCEEIVTILKANPELEAINAHIEQKKL